MAYQPHRLNEFVPNYVPHSDFLPTNQIVDGKPTDVKDLVISILSRSLNIS